MRNIMKYKITNIRNEVIFADGNSKWLAASNSNIPMYEILDIEAVKEEEFDACDMAEFELEDYI